MFRIFTIIVCSTFMWTQCAYGAISPRAADRLNAASELNQVAAFLMGMAFSSIDTFVLGLAPKDVHPLFDDMANHGIAHTLHFEAIDNFLNRYDRFIKLLPPSKRPFAQQVYEALYNDFQIIKASKQEVTAENFEEIAEPIEDLRIRILNGFNAMIDLAQMTTSEKKKTEAEILKSLDEALAKTSGQAKFIAGPALLVLKAVLLIGKFVEPYSVKKLCERVIMDGGKK